MKHINILLAFFSLFLLSQCSPSNLSYTEALDRNNRKLDTEAERNDASFLVETANYNLLLSELSKQATEQGYSRVVVDFANQALTDHMRLGEDLRNLAKNKKVSLPVSMSDRFKQISTELTVADRRNFDKTYFNTVESVYEQAIRQFEEAALNANDARVRAFAASKLEVLRNNERQADNLENQLL